MLFKRRARIGEVAAIPSIAAFVNEDFGATGRGPLLHDRIGATSPRVTHAFGDASSRVFRHHSAMDQLEALCDSDYGNHRVLKHRSSGELSHRFGFLTSILASLDIWRKVGRMARTKAERRGR
jgi:hypothetical protein